MKNIIVDEWDKDILVMHKWWIGKRNQIYTTIRIDSKRYTIYLSRLLMNCPKGMVVDHINGDTLDNRRSNLRICTQHQNMMNQHKSKVKGARFLKDRNKWQAYLNVSKPKRYFKCIGYFNTQKEAAIAYNIEAKIRFGEFACLNTI